MTTSFESGLSNEPCFGSFGVNPTKNEEYGRRPCESGTPNSAVPDLPAILIGQVDEVVGVAQGHGLAGGVAHTRRTLGLTSISWMTLGSNGRTTSPSGPMISRTICGW